MGSGERRGISPYSSLKDVGTVRAMQSAVLIRLSAGVRIRPLRAVSSLGILSGVFAGAFACAHQAPPPVVTSPGSLALRIVDSSHEAQPLLGVRLRLVGPLPRQDTIACSDSTRQAVLWVAALQPGRYQVFIRRSGFERRTALIDVAQRQTDTVTVGLRTADGNAERANAMLAPSPACTARSKAH